MKARRKFSSEFKRQVIEEVQSDLISLSEALRKYEINSSVYDKWFDKYQHGQFNVTIGKDQPTPTQPFCTLLLEYCNARCGIRP